MAANTSNHATHNINNTDAIIQRAVAYGGQKMFAPLSDAEKFGVTQVQLEFANDILVQVATLGPGDWRIDLPLRSAGFAKTLCAKSVAFGTIANNLVQSELVAAHIHVVCNYANQGHQTNHSVKPHPNFLGNSPLFCVFDGFISSITSIPPGGPTPPDEFYSLPYLFLPVAAVEGDGTDLFGDFHMGLLAISPATKTMEWLASEPTDPVFFDRLLTQVFRWLAARIDRDEAPRTLIPSEWLIRSTRGRQSTAGDQVSSEMYVMAHAQWLAFGYDRTPDQPMAWPANFTAAMQPGGDRRFRVAHDLLADAQGRFFTPSQHADLAHATNAQYYPLVDTPVVVDRTQWMAFDSMPVFDNATPPLVRNRRECYRYCPNKLAMKLHCKRNRRFYPGYSGAGVSGKGLTKRELTQWVERMDYALKRGNRVMRAFNPLETPAYWPANWIDSREDALAANCKGPLRWIWEDPK